MRRLLRPPERHGSAGRAVPLFDDPFIAHVGVGDLLDEILLLRAGSGRRAGQAAEGLHRHRRGVGPGRKARAGATTTPEEKGQDLVDPAFFHGTTRRTQRPAVIRKCRIRETPC